MGWVRSGLQGLYVSVEWRRSHCVPGQIELFCLKTGKHSNHYIVL